MNDVTATGYFGRLMAGAWKKNSPNNLHYWKVVRDMIDINAELGGGKYQKLIRVCFDWQENTFPEYINPDLTKTRSLIHLLEDSVVTKTH